MVERLMLHLPRPQSTWLMFPYKVDQWSIVYPQAA